MDAALIELLAGLPAILLAVWIIAFLALLTKGADWLVNESVALSEKSGIAKVVIGATIVSLGTTSPETAVSVVAALQGNPGLALGNAVGSIICDTGLILGLAALVAPLRIDRRLVNRQGWIQLGSGVLLVLAAWPWLQSGQVFTIGGHVPRAAGMAFLILLAAYLYISIRWARQIGEPDLAPFEKDVRKPSGVILLKLVLALVLVVGSARFLIPGVKEAAERLEVPDAIIAATLVAFGTSSPELVTALAAARKGHGDLAIGNIVGADILNVLFVTGAAAAVTRGGLQAGPHFFRILFPAMLGVLIVFRLGILFSGETLRRGFGLVLLGVYSLVLALSYLFPGAAPLHP